MDNQNKFVEFLEERCFWIFFVIGISDITLIGLSVINNYEEIFLIPIFISFVFGAKSIIYFIGKVLLHNKAKYFLNILMVICGWVCGATIGVFINLIACGFIW